MPTDALATLGARASAGMVLTPKSGIFHLQHWDRDNLFSWIKIVVFRFQFCWNLFPRVQLTHWGRDKMDAILQTTSSSAFFFNENVWIQIQISMKFVPKGPVNNIPALVQIMAWRRPGHKPLSEQMMIRIPSHIRVTRPQWVNNKPTLVQIMTWRHTGNKQALSKPRSRMA